MPNQTGGVWPDTNKFNEGKPLSSEQMKAVVDNLARRITGDGKTIRVRSFPGGQVTIEATGAKNGGSASSSSSSSVTGRFIIPAVVELPAVPTQSNIMQMVFWKSTGGGTGDDQIWWTYTGRSRWYPLTYSALDGTPGDTEYGAP